MEAETRLAGMERRRCSGREADIEGEAEVLQRQGQYKCWVNTV